MWLCSLVDPRERREKREGREERRREEKRREDKTRQDKTRLNTEPFKVDNLDLCLAFACNFQTLPSEFAEWSH